MPLGFLLTLLLALPSGHFHTAGSRIVDDRGRAVRITAVGWYGQNDLDQNAPIEAGRPLAGERANTDLMRRAGFNTVTIGWNDASLHDADRAAYLAGLDRVVAAARHSGLRIIFNHHDDEGVEGNGNCLAQQANGLWYDLGPGTDGTDGCGTPGTVTQSSFRDDWSTLARRYAHDPTVIGFDLDNEPLGYTGMSTWGDGGARDLRRMYATLGSTLEQLDPGVLIICEGPSDYTGSFGGQAGVVAPEGDLTDVRRHPVVLRIAGRVAPGHVVYSVHIYPLETSGIREDSGPAAVHRWTATWGRLVHDGVAPVWIGEAGSDMHSADDRAWARTLTDYVNGGSADQGGPRLGSGRPGVSTTWWDWGVVDDFGTLTERGTLARPPYAVYSHWQRP